MRPNQKLTGHLAGRTITNSSQAEGKLDLHLDDGSVLSVKVAASASATATAAPTGAKLLKVREQSENLSLDLEGGQSLALTLADPGASVMLRDAAGKMAYAG